MAKKIVAFLGSVGTMTVVWFFVMTIISGHAFPILGLAAAVSFGVLWGMLSGLVLGVKYSLKATLIGIAVGILFTGLDLANMRAETMGYIRGFVSEWRAYIGACISIMVPTLVFAGLGAWLQKLWTSSLKRTNQ